MIAAAYCRKSNDQSGVAEDQKSVQRQLEHAKAFAAAKGWTFADGHVYTDDGVSGSEFENRPAFAALLNALKPRAPFDVLIVSELSRLGREQLEVGFTVKRFAQAGVAIWSYLENREIHVGSAIDKFLMSAVGFAAEVEREKARDRVTDALIKKAKQGAVTGGRCFGFTNIPVTDAVGRRSHTTREINPSEAAIVREIFERCAAGEGVKAMAKRFNRRGTPPPRPHGAGRIRGWSPSAIRAMLHRRTYLGEIRYGMTKKRDAWGLRKTTKRPASDVITVPVPQLPIIEDALWTAAHARLKATAESYFRPDRGQLRGRPATGLQARYLLSGLATCSICGGSLIAHASLQGTRGWKYYRCAINHSRGKDVCSNALPANMRLADEAVLERFACVLQPDIVAGALSDAVTAWTTPPGDVEERREALSIECGRSSRRSNGS